MSSYIVVMSDHKRPKYYVARKMIGHASYAIICTTLSDFNAHQIAMAMSEARKDERNIVPIKQSRKHA